MNETHWVRGFQCNLAEMENVQQMVRENKELFSQIEVMVNNAGMISHEPQFLIMADMDNWWNVLRNNIACVVNPIRIIAPFMIRRKSGRIINVSSISGQGGDPGQSAYAASKAALANKRALGLAKPISSEALITSRLAMNLGSSPDEIIRASQ